MNLHEYQSKEIFAKYDIPVPKGIVAGSTDEAVSAAEKLGDGICVVKAQVHAGGRGKAGGVKLAKNLNEVRQYSDDMLGKRLVTHQSSSEGLPINQVYIEKGSDIDKEFYLSLVVDRASEKIIVMASAAGGMDIEEVAEKEPEKICTVLIDPAVGVSGYQVRNISYTLGLDNAGSKELANILKNLHKLFVDIDASLIEINPLIVTKQGNLIALDAKINIEDNALFRQKSISELRDLTQEDANEIEAAKYDLNYVTLDGNIACMVNGAGLAMATMDLIQLKGGKPANFLDVGGGATAERVAEAFKIILSNEKVEAVLVNIFGGIVRCDLIAEGIIAAVEQVGVSIPVVVRLEGTNVDQGRQLLANSGLSIVAATDLTKAAEDAIRLAKGDK